MQLNESVKQARDDSHRWFPTFGNTSRLVHYSLALAGEVGEFCNIVKKVDRGSLSIKDANVKYNLTCELADVLTYTLCVAGELGIDLEKALMHVRANNEKRFGADKDKK